MKKQFENIDSFSVKQSNPIPVRVIIAWLLCFAALALAGWAGEHAIKYWDVKGTSRYLLQAIIMSGLVVPGIWLLRFGFDRGEPKSIGLGNIRKAILKFTLGIGLMAVPIILAIACTLLFGWGTVSINANGSMLSTLAVGIGTVFLFEALPEELVFRGYIYSNLNVRLKRWTSALLTVGLFVLLPVLLVPFQNYILGMEITVGNSNTLTMSYIIIMVFFGSFIQYLRILTGSIWTGIGFHLMFVYINRLMGPSSESLIQFSGAENETPMQLIFVGSIVLIFIALLVYPFIIKRKLGWRESFS